MSTVNVLVVTNGVNNGPRCHKFIAPWGNDLMIMTMQPEGKMNLDRPHIPCKGEGLHDENPDNGVITQRKMKDVLYLHQTNLRPTNQHLHHGQTHF